MSTVTTATLNDYLTQLLKPQAVQDYCPNGLQVQGTASIKHLITGVTASVALIEEAIRVNADAILVHHGFFWKGEAPEIVGMKYDRIKRLLDHDINLFAYHLPLDIHPELGNNVQLADVLGIKVAGTLPGTEVSDLIWHGHLPDAETPDAFAARLDASLSRTPLHLPAKPSQIKHIAWCTGGAQNYFKYAIEAGVDAYITGEASESCFHMADESGVHYFGAGHHATERYGVQAVGAHIAKQFGIAHQYIDIPSPV